MQIVGNSYMTQEAATHVLYSRGRLFDDVDYFDALKKLSKITKRTEQQIESSLLSGERTRLKSSNSLDKLMRLEKKLKSNGLDVYIEVSD